MGGEQPGVEGFDPESYGVGLVIYTDLKFKILHGVAPLDLMVVNVLHRRCELI